MSLSLAKKSLSLIDTDNAKSAKTKRPTKRKHKNAFKQSHKQETSADSRTDAIVQRLLAYNNTKFDENVAKKILRNITKRAPKKFRRAGDEFKPSGDDSSSTKDQQQSAFTEEDFKNFEEEYKLLMANE